MQKLELALLVSALATVFGCGREGTAPNPDRPEFPPGAPAGFRATSADAAPTHKWHDLPGYLRHLQHSSSPEAKAILRQIRNGPSDLARQRALARSEGIPLSRRELQQPAPPADQNAAPLYAQIGALLAEKPIHEATDDAADGLGYRFAYTAADVARVRQLLRARGHLFDLLHQAAGRPVYARPPTPPSGLGGVLHSLHTFEGLREVARLLKAESFVLALDGRFSEAIADQARGLQVAQHAAQSPDPLNLLVAVAIQSLALDGMTDILYRAGPNARVAQQVQDAIATHPPRFSPRRALEGALIDGLGDIGDMRRLLATGGPAELSAALSDEAPEGEQPAKPRSRSGKSAAEARELWSHVLDAAEADYLREMRRLIANAQDRYPVSRAVFRQTFEQNEARPDSPERAALLIAVSLSVFRAPQVCAQAQAREAVVAAGAAVLAYRARHPGWPDNLGQAMSAPPLDPLPGKPLGYRREGDGFVVFSQGIDGRFDGGRPGDNWYQNQACFRYPPPAPYQPRPVASVAPAPSSH